jgi:hypothetical protein
MPPPKKPTKVASKAPIKAATFKPAPTATPRYVAPTPVKVAPPTGAPEADETWALATRFWFAQLWRTMLLVIPGTILLQLVLIALFTSVGEPSRLQQLIVIGLTLALSVFLQVAVVRHMLRKKQFKGFTFTLKGRE